MKMTNTQLYLRLLGYVKPYWRVFSVALIATAISAATDPLLPALLKPWLDGTFVHKTICDALGTHNSSWLFSLCGPDFIYRYLCHQLGRRKLVLDLRDEMFRKMLAMPTRFYDEHSTGKLISKITFDVTQVTEAAPIPSPSSCATASY